MGVRLVRQGMYNLGTIVMRLGMCKPATKLVY